MEKNINSKEKSNNVVNKIINKYVIILLAVFGMIVLFLFIKSKIPNDKYRAKVYSGTDEIMQNFEENKSNFEEFISYFESSEYN